MAFQVGALGNPMAALVMAVLLMLLLGSAALVYLARSVTQKLEGDRKRDERGHRHAA